MSDKSVNINVDKHEGGMGERIFEIVTGGFFGTDATADRYDATVSVGDRTYTGSGRTYDEAVDAAKHEAGID